MKGFNMIEIPLPEERTQPWPEVDRMALYAITARMAKSLAKKFSYSTLEKIDALNKEMPEHNDALWQFVEPVEMFAIFQQACEDSNQNFHNPHFTECWTLLKKHGYVFCATN